MWKAHTATLKRCEIKRKHVNLTQFIICLPFVYVTFNENNTPNETALAMHTCADVTRTNVIQSIQRVNTQ